MSERRPKILLIETESHILRLVQANLQHAGFDVLTACTDEEALLIAADALPDIAVHLDDEGWRTLEQFLKQHDPRGQTRCWP
jgi:DNA-binding response OmpR family regulator